MKSNSSNPNKDKEKSKSALNCKNSESLEEEAQRKSQIAFATNEMKANDSDDSSQSEDSDIGLLDSSIASFSRADPSDDFQVNTSGFMGFLQTLVQNNGTFNISHSNNEFDCIIENLVQRDDKYLILECAKDLSERLLMMDNVTADRVIPSSRLTNALIKILSDESLACDLEIHLVVCRCLYNLMELHEAFVIEAIHNNAIEAILPHLVEIVYIDLTEQCLQVLEALSVEKSAHHRFIENGGVHACLRNLEFLTMHSQKKCMKIISNSACSASPSQFKNFESEFATFLNILVTRDDTTMVEHARHIIFKIINCIQHDSKKIELLFKSEVLTIRFTEIALNTLEGTSSTKFESQSPTILLSSLICLASSSKLIRDTLLKGDIGAKILSSLLKDEEDSGIPQVTSTSSGELSADILKLIGSFIPLPVKTEQNDLLFRKCSSWDKLQDESLQDSQDLRRYFEQVYPILIQLYHEAIEFDVQLCVLQELVKMFSTCEKLALTPCINYRDSINIVSNVLFDWNNALEDNTSPNSKSILRLLLVFSACLIVQIAFQSWEPQHVGLLYRVGVVDYLIDLLEPLDYKASTFEKNDSLSQEHKLLLRTLVRIANEIVEENRANTFKEGAYANYMKELKSLLYSFSLHPASDTPVSEGIKDLWTKFLGLFSPDDYPTCYELHSLGILKHILAQLKSADYGNSLYKSISSVLINKSTSFVQFVQCLHELAGKILVSQITPSNKRGLTEMRLMEGKRILIKLKPKNLNSFVQSSKQELILLVPAIVSFTTLKTLLSRNLKLIANLGPCFDSLSSNCPSPSLEESLEIVFYYHRTAVCNSTPLYSIVADAPTSSEIQSDAIANTWGKTHEFTFSLETTSGSKLQIVPLKASQLETTSLSILSALYSINENLLPHNDRFDPEVFRNRVFDQLLLKQLDYISVTRIGELPEVCVHLITEFPFLFLFNVKLQFIRSFCFGMTRSLISFAQTQVKQSKKNSQSYELCRMLLDSAGFPSKIKLRVCRNKIFKSALAVLNAYSLESSILEFQFYDEAGSGLGPTLEFYSLVSSSFSRIHYMWNTSAREGLGLFPIPLTGNDTKLKARVSNLFQKLGNFLARALLDSRQVDFHFNSLLLLAIRDWSEYSSRIMSCGCLRQVVDLLLQVDPVLASSLRQLLTYPEPDRLLDNRQIDTMSINYELEDLCLNFVLPGNSNYELVKNGRDIAVTRKNVTKYVTLVAKTILCEGIELQVESLRTGFAQLLPLEILRILSVSELDELFGHANENWSMEVLKACVEADHGYSSESPAVVNFLSILHEFSKEERRQFLQFLTGSPRLPVGGFSALHPKLTVVKKYNEQGATNDAQLPSVMTCANYFKLPNYSLKYLMKSRIIRAMREGSGEFFLS